MNEIKKHFYELTLVALAYGTTYEDVAEDIEILEEEERYWELAGIKMALEEHIASDKEFNCSVIIREDD